MVFNELLQLPLQTAPAVQGDTDVTYAQAGQGDLLVLIHGSLCDLRYWRWQLKRLATDCQVLALSLPGYWPDAVNTDAAGGSHAFDFDAHVKAVADAVQAVRHPEQKLYVLGHSRGAQIAMQYAHENTQTVDALLLADAAFRIDETTPPLPVIQEAAKHLEQGDEQIALGLFIDAVNGANTWEQMVGWFRTMVQDNSTTLLPQSKETLPTVSAQQIQSLRELPVLLINGENSPERYQNSAQALQQQLPHAKRLKIRYASHGMNLANPKAFNSTVLEFMRLSQNHVL